MSGSASPPPRPLVPRLGLRTWLLVSHLLVLAIPAAFVVLSGILRHELHRQAADELTSRAPLVSRILTRELELARQLDPSVTLADVGPQLAPWLAPADDVPYPVHVWIFDGAGHLLGSTMDEVRRWRSGRSNWTELYRAPRERRPPGRRAPPAAGATDDHPA